MHFASTVKEDEEEAAAEGHTAQMQWGEMGGGWLVKTDSLGYYLLTKFPQYWWYTAEPSGINVSLMMKRLSSGVCQVCVIQNKMWKIMWHKYQKLWYDKSNQTPQLKEIAMMINPETLNNDREQKLQPCHQGDTYGGDTASN